MVKDIDRKAAVKQQKAAAAGGTHSVEAHSRSSWLDLLAIFHSYLLLAGIFPLFASIEKLTGGEWLIFTAFSLTLFLPVTAGFFMIRKIRNFAVYLLLSLLIVTGLAASAFVVSQGMPIYAVFTLTLLIFLLSAVIMITRGKARLEQSRLQQDFESQHGEQENVLLDAWETQSFLNSPQPMQWIFTALLYVPSVLAGYTKCYRLLFVMFLADVFVVFLHIYMERFQNYIKNHHHVANMPLSMMKKVHKTLMTIAVTLVFLAVLPSILFGREPLDGYRPNIHIQVSTEIVEQEMSQEGGMDQGMMLEELAGDSGWVPPEWVKDVMNAIVYLVGAATCVGILYAIWMRFKEAGRDFAVEDEDEVIFLDDVIEDSAEEIMGEKKKKDGFLSPNMQIRRKYRKSIQSGTPGKPSSWAAPRELEKDASWTGTEKQKALHGLYEKARYSEAGCSREDLDTLR